MSENNAMNEAPQGDRGAEVLADRLAAMMLDRGGVGDPPRSEAAKVEMRANQLAEILVKMVGNITRSTVAREGWKPPGRPAESGRGDSADEAIEPWQVDPQAATLEIQVVQEGVLCELYGEDGFVIGADDIDSFMAELHALVMRYRLAHVVRLAAAAGVPGSLKLGAVSDRQACGDVGA